MERALTMNIKSRIEKLERYSPIIDSNTYKDWIDEELEMAISLSDLEYRTGLKQHWSEELSRKRAAIPDKPSELDNLSNDDLEAMIIRLERELTFEKGSAF